MSSIVTIRIGQTGDSFVRSNSLGNIEVRREPAGIDFYDVDWPRKLPGVVRVDHKSFSFRIEGALGFLGSEDTLLPEEGLSSVQIGAGITIEPTISHELARDRIMAVLQELLTIGWRRNIVRSEPRLHGMQAVNYSIEQFGVYSLDPAYTPTIEEWMRLRAYSQWDLYADGVYLTLRFMRDSDRMDVNAPGAYYISWGLRSEADELREYFVSTDRSRWKELWLERAKEAQQERLEAEAKMRARGWTIDTGYSDPPVLGVGQK